MINAAEQTTTGGAQAAPGERDRAPLSLDRVVASLQVILATRRAARNAERNRLRDV